MGERALHPAARHGPGAPDRPAADRRAHDIRDGALHLKQNKTGRKLAIEITGELAQVIDRITSRPAKIKGTWLIQDESGQPLPT
jgi:hypothetical protein